MKESGYVYILTNPCFREDIVKIGITASSVEKRMKELHTIGVPLPFEKYASYQTSKFKEVEYFMHRSLALLTNNRVNNSREFFYIKPEVALDYLMQIADLLGEGKVESCMPAAEIAKKDIIKRQAYQDKEDWLKDNNREHLRVLIDELEKIGFGYHLGTSDLRIDFTPKDSKKSYNCLMLLGRRNYASFQPSELYKLVEVSNVKPQIAADFLDKLRPYLMPKQKHLPYELHTGYYNISHETLNNRTSSIVDLYAQLLKNLNCQL